MCRAGTELGFLLGFIFSVLLGIRLLPPHITPGIIAACYVGLFSFWFVAISFYRQYPFFDEEFARFQWCCP